MVCAMGILMALLERAKSGQGQVVDAAMVCDAVHDALTLSVPRAVPFTQSLTRVGGMSCMCVVARKVEGASYIASLLRNFSNTGFVYVVWIGEHPVFEGLPPCKCCRHALPPHV